MRRQLLAAHATPVVLGEVGMVNRPEDDVLDWSSINWRQVEGDVRRLRQRIFSASQAGDFKRVRGTHPKTGLLTD
ncbi:MAG TPA: reverse transcriptase N-terminal domain-containing protein [Jatrophihabitantaceae bacterium]|jgi:RNA-directed DNA polymerase